MSRTFFISDMHFFHANCLLYEPERISLVENTLNIQVDIERFNNDNDYKQQITTAFVDIVVKRWNKVVKADDIIWCLGDIGLGSKDTIANVLSRLNGHKRLIRGNHDNFSDNWYREHGFDFVSKYPIILKGHFILSHAPIDNMEYNPNMFFIYGHVHSNSNFQTITDNSRCVCVERQSFTPIRIYEFDNYETNNSN